MDQAFGQMDIARCKDHPQMVISFIFYQQMSPYKSRLACNKCIQEYNTFSGFEDVLNLLQDQNAILNKFDRSYGKYDQLMEYFHLLEQDPEEFIHIFQENILKQIKQLEVELKEGIEKFKAFRQEIAKAKEQFQEIIVFNKSNQALEYKQLRQAFKDILIVENYHSGEEWKKFEDKVQSYILQFASQDNQELNETYYKLQQMEQTFFKPELLSDFKSKVTKNVEQMCRKLRLFPKCSSLCDPLYFSELIDRIYSQSNEQPNVKLIFKGSSDGMNAKAFWGKCGNQGRTIIFCKSKSGHVFGGYTPCKWEKLVQDAPASLLLKIKQEQKVPNQLNVQQQLVWKKQEDSTQTSFLFSYTRKEIYPILQSLNAISSPSDSSGFQFGNAPDLQITDNFQNGCSYLTGQSYSTEKYKILNNKTHLMGGEKPDLVEMEVFLLS